MMNNLFGIFDPATTSSLMNNWTSSLLLLFIPTGFWITKNRLLFSLSKTTNLLNKEMSLNLGMIKTPGVTWFTVSLFFYIVITNYSGLMPYTFTSSSHLSFTLSLAMLVWLSLIMGSLTMSLSDFMIHLVPYGTPTGLISLMVLIELVSVMIRPITLSVRLAANMVAGHLLISLVCIPSLTSNFTLIMCFLGASIMMILESAVALIQAYVFSSLSSLYISDLNETVKL